LTAKLAKIGDSRMKQQALIAVGGPLSAQGMAAAKTIDSLGAVITGVNDTPETVVFGDDSSQPTGGPVASAPMPAAALADQQAREAKFGYGAQTQASAVPTPTLTPTAPLAGGKVAVFDVSEGTNLDPLRNKTYDLSFAKEVPNLK
jgi:UPF0755 protein